jgi:hypothetical protein
LDASSAATTVAAIPTHIAKFQNKHTQSNSLSQDPILKYPKDIERIQLETLLRESGASRLLFNPQRPENNNNKKQKCRSRASNLLTRHKEDDKEHRRPHRACNCRRLPQQHNEEMRRKKEEKQPQILPMRQMTAANLQPLEEFNKSLRHQ